MVDQKQITILSVETLLVAPCNARNHHHHNYNRFMALFPGPMHASHNKTSS